LFVGAGTQAVRGASEGFGTWGPSNGPEGGVIGALAVDPKNPNVVYAGALWGGFYKSENAGRSWRVLGVDPTAAVRGALVVDPRRPRTIYVGSGRGVFKSTDAGETWRSASAGLFRKETEQMHEWRLVEGWVTKLEIDPRNSNTLYAATYGGVAKTTNGGQTWRRINKGLKPRLIEALAIDPRRPSTIYVGDVQAGSSHRVASVFKSTDGGKQWRAAGLPSEPVYVLEADPKQAATLYAGTSDGIFKTVDGGRSWTAVGLHGSSIGALALDPVRPETIYAGSGDRLLKSTDAGATWESTTLGVATGRVDALAVDPRNSSTLYAGTAAGVYKSTDGATAWQQANAGFIATLVSALVENSGTLYAATPSGVFCSAGRGVGWRVVNSGLEGEYIRTLAVDPSDASTLYAGTATGVFKTTNMGGIWRRTGLENDVVDALAVDPHSANVIYAGTYGYGDRGTYGGVFKSLDGGRTWVDTDLRSPLRQLVVESGRPAVSAIAIAARASNIVYAGTDVGLFKSADGGHSWKQVTAGVSSGASLGVMVHSIALDPADTETIYIATYTGVRRSTDGGEDWQSTSLGLPPNSYVVLGVDPRRPGTLYAGAWPGAGVFESNDRGESWHPLGRGLRGRSVAALALDPGDRVIYAGTFGGGVVDLVFSRSARAQGRDGRCGPSCWGQEGEGR